MKNKIIILFIAFTFSLFLSQSVWADELSELKAQVSATQELLQNQTKQIEELQKKIERLERERASEIAAPQEWKERIIAVEEKLTKPYEGGLLSLKGSKWEIGGELKLDFIATKKHAGMEEKSPHFQLNKFVLIPKISLDEDISLYSEIEFYRTSLEVKMAFVQFDNLPQFPAKTFLKAGVEERFMKPSRKTERYPLAGNAFWRDSEIGIFAGGKLKPLNWYLSYASGFTVDQKAVTMDNSFKILHDERKTSNYASPGELGLGLGNNSDFKKFGKLDTLGFVYLSKISAVDEAFLNTNVTGYHSDERGQYRYGVNLNHSLSDANLFIELIKARDGDLDRLAWYIQPSYKFNLGKIFDEPDRKYFTVIEPLFRYGKLSVTNIDAVTSNSLTWDRAEFTFAVIMDIYKNIKLKNEYTIDRIDRGTDGIKNYGEFVSQLEVKF